MSFRVRFSREQPSVAYVGSKGTPVDGFTAQLLSRPLPPPHREENFDMDLHTAASIGHTDVIKILVERKQNPNGKNKTGWCPIHYSSYLGHEAATQLLIKAAAKIDETNEKGQTALMLAAACGNKSVVELLLQAGARCTANDVHNRQALHYAASCSQNVIVDQLLARGGDPNARDDKGMTALLEACVAGHELTFTSLLKKGGNPLEKNLAGEDGVALASEAPRILQLIEDHRPRAGNGGVVVEPTRARQTQNLGELLHAMNLARFAPKFKAENIDLPLFFELTEKNLDEMGIAYGPKKLFLAVIERYKKTGVVSPEALTFKQDHDRPKESDSSTSEVTVSLRYVRETSEQTKALALQALSALRNTDHDRLRSLLPEIINGLDRIHTTTLKHSL